MRIAILTNEYPPHVYGGAGVHVEYLTRELAAIDDGQHAVQVICFGDQQERRESLRVDGVRPPVSLSAQDPRHAKLFATMLQDLVMSGRVADVDVVHCHTWYTHLAGCVAKYLHGVPLVLTTHSLEPHRPWKAEQLGTAYQVSTWLERTAYHNADGVVAVSEAMKHDVQQLDGVLPDRIRVIHNGIDLEQYRPSPDPATLRDCGIDPDVPYVLFVGRVTRQKGIIHLVNAIRHFRPGVQVVLCAGAPDTPEIAREMPVDRPVIEEGEGEDDAALAVDRDEAAVADAGDGADQRCFERPPAPASAPESPVLLPGSRARRPVTSTGAEFFDDRGRGRGAVIDPWPPEARRRPAPASAPQSRARPPRGGRCPSGPA